MSTDHTDEAVEAARRAVREMAFDWACPKVPYRMRYECRECVADVALAAALPALRAQIETEVRKQIADEIESHANAADRMSRQPEQLALRSAAWIARGKGGQS